MKKLILTSAAFGNTKIKEKFMELSGKPTSELKVIFIPTASRYENELKWVKASKTELISFGIKPENIFDFNLDRKLKYNDVKDYDIIYVCGGNTFYLLSKINESGFGEVIKKLVKAGKLYIGVSAGSILAGPDICSCIGFDENDIGLKNFTGLSLTNTVTYVHYIDKEKKIVEKIRKESKYPIVTLTNSQALIIVGDKETVVG